MISKIQALKNVSHYGVKSLLTIGQDAKTVKGEKLGFLTGIMYLTPSDDLCPMSEFAGCRVPCLVTAGRASMFEAIPRARKNRTDLFQGNKPAFFELLIIEIKAMVLKAEKLGLTPVIRLNGTSDIDWNNEYYGGKTIFEIFKQVQFYDYTKRPNIIRKSQFVKNYHVSASYSGSNNNYSNLIESASRKYGVNLVVVFSGALPEFYKGLRVVNGDLSDLRFLDDKRVIVGLKAKGKAKQDKSGFVIDSADLLAVA